MSRIRRRDLLKGTGLALVGSAVARAGIVAGELPWEPDKEARPDVAEPGPWLFFVAAEAAVVEAMVDRIIPPDPLTPGGKDAGCAVFIDRQLASPYGSSEDLYNSPPFEKGSKQQGPQSSQTPSILYRASLAAFDRYCRSTQGGRPFSALEVTRQDEILQGLDAGSIRLDGADGKTFFDTVLKDAQMGFFADPIHGANRDMCAWKMIGFPGARYDYRDWVGRHNERYPYPPVSIGGRPEWNLKKT